jgi:serine/threonine protein kinase
MAAVPAGLATALQDRYRLDRELGQGGMATVFLAHDLRNNREVAIKILRPELAAILGSVRFLKEIEVTANLQHPHILPLFDSGVLHASGGATEGQPYYVMPYVAGESLRERLEREGPLPVDDAVELVRQVAGALDYAHRQGVIHRDIKPANILLHEGNALLADFGIALAVKRAGGVRLTETGLSLGTPQYMSPEQATAERRIDARSDVYSLGAVLYEMLAGEPPFTGMSAQAVIARLMVERPTPLRTLRASVSPGLEAVVERALAKLPADRFPSAAAFGEALAAPPRQLAHRRLSSRLLPIAGLLVVALALLWWNDARRIAEQRRGRQLELTNAAAPALSAERSQLPDSVVRAIRLGHLVPDTETIRYVFAPHGRWLSNSLVLTNDHVIRISPEGSRRHELREIAGVGSATFRDGTTAVYLQLAPFRPPAPPDRTSLFEEAAYMAFDTIYKGLNAREAALLFDALNAVTPVEEGTKSDESSIVHPARPDRHK